MSQLLLWIGTMWTKLNWIVKLKLTPCILNDMHLSTRSNNFSLLYFWIGNFCACFEKCCCVMNEENVHPFMSESFVIVRKKGILFRYLCLCCSTVHCIHECTTDYLQKGESSCYICYYLSMMWSQTTLLLLAILCFFVCSHVICRVKKISRHETKYPDSPVTAGVT